MYGIIVPVVVSLWYKQKKREGGGRGAKVIKKGEVLVGGRGFGWEGGREGGPEHTRNRDNRRL